MVSTLAGSGSRGSVDGAGAAASFADPVRLLADGKGNVYVADKGNASIRLVRQNGAVSTYAGANTSGPARDGAALQARFANSGMSLARGADGTLYIGDGPMIKTLGTDSNVALYAGSTVLGFSDGTRLDARFNAVQSLQVGADGSLLAVDVLMVRRIDRNGTVSTDASIYSQPNTPRVLLPAGMPETALPGPDGAWYYGGANDSTVKRVAPNGSVDIYAGAPYAPGVLDAAAQLRSFASPRVLGFNPAGSLLVRDEHGIRSVNADRSLSAYLGSGADAALLATATATTFDTQGNMDVVDQGNSVVRKVTPAGVITTIAGNGKAGIALGALPGGLCQPTSIVMTGTRTLVVTSHTSVLKIVLP